MKFVFDAITAGSIAVAMAVSLVAMIGIMLDHIKSGKFIMTEAILQMIEALLIGMYLAPIFRPTIAVSEQIYKFILATCPAGAQIMIGLICVAIWGYMEDQKEWKKRKEDQANKPDNGKEGQAEQENKPDNKE